MVRPPASLRVGPTLSVNAAELNGVRCRCFHSRRSPVGRLPLQHERRNSVLDLLGGGERRRRQHESGGERAERYASHGSDPWSCFVSETSVPPSPGPCKSTMSTSPQPASDAGELLAIDIGMRPSRRGVETGGHPPQRLLHVRIGEERFSRHRPRARPPATERCASGSRCPLGGPCAPRIVRPRRRVRLRPPRAAYGPEASGESARLQRGTPARWRAASALAAAPTSPPRPGRAPRCPRRRPSDSPGAAHRRPARTPGPHRPARGSCSRPGSPVRTPRC